MKCSSLVVFCSCRGQASALQTRSARTQRHFQTGTSCGASTAGPKSPDLAIHSVNLVYFSALRRWCSRMGGQDLVIGHLVPHAVCYEQHPVAVATSARCGTAMMLFLASLAGTADARCSDVARASPAIHAAQPQSHQATMLSTAKQLDVPELDRAEQDHHRQHGWRASVRLYSRDDVWGAWRASGQSSIRSRTVSAHSDPFGRAPSRARPARHPDGGCTRRRQHTDHQRAARDAHLNCKRSSPRQGTQRRRPNGP